MLPLCHCVTVFFREDVVRLLLQSNIDPNATSSRGITPLHVAAKEGHFRLLQMLIFANALVNAQSANGITPLVRLLNVTTLSTCSCPRAALGA